MVNLVFFIGESKQVICKTLIFNTKPSFGFFNLILALALILVNQYILLGLTPTPHLSPYGFSYLFYFYLLKFDCVLF
jgi:hypothetical protein